MNVLSEMSDVERITPEELLRRPDGDRYELVNGIPTLAIRGGEVGEIASSLAMIVGSFIRRHKLGFAFLSTGYRCFSDDSNRVRIPTFSFVSTGRFLNERPPKLWIRIAPDLAVEVISPNDLYEEIETKVNEFFTAGTKLFWIVSSGSRTVLVRRPDGTANVLKESDTLTGENVVPGFSTPVAEMFE